MGQLKKLAGQTAIYGVSSIVGRLLNWLLTPFYTGIFEPGEYGQMTILYGYSAFLLVIYTYGLETTFFRFSTRDITNGQNTYGQVMTMIVLTTLIFTIALWAFAQPIASFIEYPNHSSWIRWFAAILAVEAVMSIPFAKLRLENRPIKFASIKILVILVTILLNIFLLVVAPAVISGESFVFMKPLVTPWYDSSLGIEYIFIANFLGTFLLVPLLAKELMVARFNWNRKLIRQILAYSLPVGVMGLAGTVNETFGRLMIKYLLPDGFYGSGGADYATGVYGACFKLSVFMNLGIQAFRYAAEPFFFSSAADKNSPELFSKVMKWFVIFGALVFLGISVNLNWLGLLLRQSEYREALFIVPFLLMGYLFLGIYYNLSVWYKLTDQTYYGAYIALLGALITVVGNVLLIPVIGYLGSAVVTTLTFLVMAVVSFYLGEKYYPVPYKVSNAFFYLILSSGLVLGVSQLHLGSFLLQVLANNLAVLCFIVVVVIKERADLPRPKRFIS
ncbi:MAG: lipopolysaccharide biosynthesis protein [Imperialibacter sp.]|uniref:lipopolysaccharide biosynthesis protein n=1 Tax=Imperialibacter sp. TaxID=2038411 RepID=UPI003A847821